MELKGERRLRILILLMVLILIPIASGLQECQRVVEPIDINCTIYSSGWKPENCADHNISIYNSSHGLVQIQQWTNQTSVCEFEWNISKLGSYLYNSSIETGVVTVEADDFMLSMIIGLGIVAALLFFLAFKIDEEHFLLKLLMTITGVTMIFLIPATYIITDPSQMFYRLVLYFFVAFWLYVIVYYVYYLLNKMGIIVAGKNE